MVEHIFKFKKNDRKTYFIFAAFCDMVKFSSNTDLGAFFLGERLSSGLVVTVCFCRVGFGNTTWEEVQELKVSSFTQRSLNLFKWSFTFSERLFVL